MTETNLIRTKSFELAVLTRGDKNAEKLALLLPGRLDTKDYGNFVSHAEYLAQRGFFAVAFDPPGTWNSPGGIDLYTTTNYIRAVNELIEYFGNKPTLLFGHSRGAAVAIFASSNPAVVGIVPVMLISDRQPLPTMRPCKRDTNCRIGICRRAPQERKRKRNSSSRLRTGWMGRNIMPEKR